MVKESKELKVKQNPKQPQKFDFNESNHEVQKHSRKIKNEKYKQHQKEKNIYIDNSSEEKDDFDNNKFIPNDIEKNFEVFDLLNYKLRKNSKESEGYSTSNEDNKEKEKIKEKKN